MKLGFKTRVLPLSLALFGFGTFVPIKAQLTTPVLRQKIVALKTPVQLSGFSLSAYEPKRPARIMATLYLEVPAPERGLDVRLTTSECRLARVPPTLHISPRALSATFPIQLYDEFFAPSVLIAATLGKSRVDIPFEFYKPISFKADGIRSGENGLFWRGVPGALGYNIYRGTKSEGKHTRINRKPVTTRDPSPELEDAYFYRDRGLKNGRTYYYVVVAVMAGKHGNRETARSDESSATPDKDAIPWDTRDAKKIVTAFAKRDRKYDPESASQSTYYQFPAPNGIAYEGRHPGVGKPVLIPGEEPGDPRIETKFNADGTLAPIDYDFTAKPQPTKTIPANALPIQKPSRDPDALPRIKTLISSRYQPSQSGKVYYPEHEVLFRLDFEAGADAVTKVVGEQRLFQIDQEKGIYSFTTSPDRQQIIATFDPTNFTPSYGRVNELEWIATDGSRRKRLTQDRGGYDDLQWASDLKRIAYTSHQGEPTFMDADSPIRQAVYVQDIGTGKRHKLFDEQILNREDRYERSAPAILEWLSPTQLLYSSTRPRGLFLLDTGGKPPVRLALDVPNRIDLAHHVAIWQEYESNQLRLAPLPTDPAALTRPETWNALKPTITADFPQIISELSFASDNHTVAIALTPRLYGEAPTRLLLFDFVTRRVRFIGYSEKRLTGFRWSRNGKWLIVTLDLSSPTPSNFRNEIVAIPVPPGDGVPLEQFDPMQTTPLIWKTILTLPAGVYGGPWLEED